MFYVIHPQWSFFYSGYDLSVFQLYSDSIITHGQAKHLYLIYSWTVMIVLLETVNRIHGYEGYGKKGIIIFFQLDYFLL